MFYLRKLIYFNLNFYLFVKKLFQLNLIKIVHEKEIYSFKYLNLEKNKFILDIGASDGLFFKSLLNSKIKNKVISVEPLRNNLIFLKKIKKKYKNFYYHNIAISNSNYLNIFTPKYNNFRIDNFTSFSKKDALNNLKKNFKFLNTKLINFDTEKVKAKKLDYFINFNIGLLKLDIEGYEINAINSGKKLILKYKPIIYIENNNRIFKKNNFLQKLGYRAYFFDNEKKIFSLTNNLKSNYALLLIKKKHLLN